MVMTFLQSDVSQTVVAILSSNVVFTAVDEM